MGLLYHVLKKSKLTEYSDVINEYMVENNICSIYINTKQNLIIELYSHTSRKTGMIIVSEIIALLDQKEPSLEYGDICILWV